MEIRKLKADEIECRVKTIGKEGCSLLLYKTARVDRAILDEICGSMNWQNEFKVIDGKMYGGIGIFNQETKQWVWKWDCGTESNTEAEKGQASDCFKRAGFKWGIGVELYSAPFIWVNCQTVPKDNKKYDLADKFAKFKVSSIDYSEKGDISKLEITDKNRSVVYKMGSFVKKTTPPIDNDLDLFEGLKACSDLKMLAKYYQDNYQYVKNKKEFVKIKDSLKAKFSKGA